MAPDIDPGLSSDKEGNSGQISAMRGDTARKLHETNGKHATNTRKVPMLAAPCCLGDVQGSVPQQAVALDITGFRIWRERNQELWPDLRPECVASEVVERECDRSADSTWPRSFDRKSQVPGHSTLL